jgi:hypothetical protein
MAPAPALINGKEYTYATAISFAQIQSTFTYAQKLGFFNTKLNNDWNNDIF